MALDKQQPTGDPIKTLVRRPVEVLQDFHRTGFLLVSCAARGRLKERGSFKNVDWN